MTLSLAQRRAFLATGLMAGAAGLGQWMVPTRRLADLRGLLDLKNQIPKTFGVWKQDTWSPALVVDPQTEALIRDTYSQTLDRTYVNDKGQRVMLVLAYEEDQSNPRVQIHYPEVCYPAQGFQIASSRRDEIALTLGKLKVRRLETSRGQNRPEPVTYWTMIGELQSLDSVEKRISEIRHGLKGEIVDGMLVRVSTIGSNSAREFELQDQFVRSMLTALPADMRLRLAGFKD